MINHKFSLENVFQEFCTGLIIGLTKDLAGLLSQLTHNTLTFQLKDHYQEVLI